ncbi:hypothetical protein ABVK25_012444 [Lepraria finkii]|uniref:Uncharacterized protein n=1 Tax=Lepraria finkii TaxID=1340010 RepID=A0ABR4AEB7_9LECA
MDETDPDSQQEGFLISPSGHRQESLTSTATSRAAYPKRLPLSKTRSTMLDIKDSATAPLRRLRPSRQTQADPILPTPSKTRTELQSGSTRQRPGSEAPPNHEKVSSPSEQLPRSFIDDLRLAAQFTESEHHDSITNRASKDTTEAIDEEHADLSLLRLYQDALMNND